MALTVNKEKIVKDLTITEFKRLIQESIAEDVEAWKNTFAVMADKTLMRQIKSAEKSRIEGKKADYIPWDKVRRSVHY
jgi:hypothetical protein